MKTEDQTINDLAADLDRYATALKSARTILRVGGLLTPDAVSVAHDLRRLGGALVAAGTELMQAQRLAAADARTELTVS